jgi:hypothetical protein
LPVAPKTTRMDLAMLMVLIESDCLMERCAVESSNDERIG